jgi:hypothetical protein
MKLEFTRIIGDIQLAFHRPDLTFAEDPRRSAFQLFKYLEPLIPVKLNDFSIRPGQSMGDTVLVVTMHPLAELIYSSFGVQLKLSELKDMSHIDRMLDAIEHMREAQERYSSYRYVIAGWLKSPDGRETTVNYLNSLIQPELLDKLKGIGVRGSGISLAILSDEYRATFLIEPAGDPSFGDIFINLDYNVTKADGHAARLAQVTKVAADIASSLGVNIQAFQVAR